LLARIRDAGWLNSGERGESAFRRNAA
jgi:hypothetical protein